MREKRLANRLMGSVIGGLVLALSVPSLMLMGSTAWADEPSIASLQSEMRALKRQVERLEPLKAQLKDLEAKLASQGMSADVASSGSGDKWIKIGGGLRTSMKAVQDASPDGRSYSQDIAVENMRLYANGQLMENLQVEFNTAFISDTSGTTAEVRVLDAIVKARFNDAFQVWAGRFIPPSDRSNISGPFFMMPWDFPFVSNYPTLFGGRDDGAALWGQFNEGQFKYQVGAFEGTDAAPNGSDNLLYAGRLTYNFWDPEPGYYHSSTYYGAKDIFAVGLVGQWQADGAGTTLTSEGNFFGSNVDVLIEKTLDDFGGGVGTLEGAYYKFDLDRAPDTGLIEGNGFMGLVGYLFPTKIGVGQFQPHVRYQNFNDHSRTDVGLNYIIDGHNARLSAVYSLDDAETVGDINRFILGGQFQF